MSKIEKMATRIAAEMVEAHLNHGATIVNCEENKVTITKYDFSDIN